MIGEVRIVDDVPAAFADVVRDVAPRTLALSGGETARRCYERLRAVDDIVWDSTVVVFGDDRFVPTDHPDSNEGMARAALLDHVPVAAVHPMWRADVAVDDAAEAYDAVIADVEPLDLIHLGLGEDAHTASLFPGTAALEATTRRVVANESPAHPHPRLTLTLPAIAAARLVVVTVEGAAKRDALARVRAGDRTAPATHVDRREVVWLVDRAAAAT